MLFPKKNLLEQQNFGRMKHSVYNIRENKFSRLEKVSRKCYIKGASINSEDLVTDEKERMTGML